MEARAGTPATLPNTRERPKRTSAAMPLPAQIISLRAAKRRKGSPRPHRPDRRRCARWWSPGLITLRETGALTRMFPIADSLLANSARAGIAVCGQINHSGVLLGQPGALVGRRHNTALHPPDAHRDNHRSCCKVSERGRGPGGGGMDAVPVQDPDTTSVGVYGVSPAKRPGLPSTCPRLPSGAVYAGPSLCGKRAPRVRRKRHTAE